MRKVSLFVCLIFAFSLGTSSIGFSAAAAENQLIAGQAFRVGQVNVLSLPEAAGHAVGPPRTIPLHVPDPQALAQEKRAALQPGFVPPGNDQKVIINSTSTGPLTVSSNPALSGAPGGDPNPCSCSPPDVIVDVGGGYVFEMVNLAGIIYNTAGGLAKNTFALSGFFGLPTSSMSDPFVVYDASSGRWFASIIDIPHGRVQFAVSTTSNPTGTWSIYHVSAASNMLPDQPFIGTSDDKFVISANDFVCGVITCFFQGVQYWILNKSQLANGASSVNFVTNSPDSTLFSVHPARHLSATSAFYMVTVGVGSTSTAKLLTITGVPPSTVAVATFSFAINPMSSPPDAQQPGTSTLLATNDDRVLSAVWLSNIIWFSANDACLLGGDTKTRSCLRLIQVSTSGTPAKLNDFDYALSGNYFFYPAVSMDGQGNLLIVYGRSSTTVYPSLYVTALQSNALQTPVIIASGTAPDTSTRFGDYFGAGTDLQTSTFWIAGEYRTDSTFQNWSTAIAQVFLTSTGSFDFSLSNSGGITGTQGGSGSNTITATLTSGTTQTVSLSCDSSSLPSGASCSFNPASGNPTFTSALTIGTLSSTPTGTYSISVIGTGGGLTRSTSFALTVNTASSPTLSVSVNTDKGSYAKGSTVTSTVTVTSSGVAVSGATVTLIIKDPSGNTVSSQSGTTGSSGTVKFTWTIPNTAPSGKYTAQATASATGYTSGSRSTTFKVR